MMPSGTMMISMRSTRSRADTQRHKLYIGHKHSKEAGRDRKECITSDLPHHATWEPIGNMNDNCRELVAKARALFAWRRPGQGPAPGRGTIWASYLFPPHSYPKRPHHNML
eukprot:5305524-Amphidinium_carterae.1